ncbi:MAG: septum formation initiator family protein [Nitrospirae bacterium]|nr:septum formation initiator family protein [Nitrospirota bacterium]
MRNIRRKQVEHNRKRRRLVLLTVGILLFVYFSFTLLVGESGFLKYMELRSNRDKFLDETRVIKKQNEDIQGEINTLKKSPELMEEFAREYGLTKDGELIFKFEDKK